jgi:nucleotide-binding universal stress UspA family protein
MRRILVAVDGSEPSLHAARQAAEIALKMNAKVTCAYVIAPPFYPPEALYIPPPELLEAERRVAEQALTKAAEAVRAIGCEVNAILLQGAPAEELVNAAEQSPEIDLVVVGNRGRNAVSRVLLGSVADRVVHLCKKPVLVVRAG